VEMIADRSNKYLTRTDTDSFVHQVLLTTIIRGNQSYPTTEGRVPTPPVLSLLESTTTQI
jgi:hypothetical protein